MKKDETKPKTPKEKDNDIPITKNNKKARNIKSKINNKKWFFITLGATAALLILLLGLSLGNVI